MKASIANSNGPGKTLRFAVMCTGDEVPAGFAKCIEELLAIKEVELALLIVDNNPPTQETMWEKAKQFLSFNRALWAIHARLFPSEQLPCYRPVNMSHIFARVPRIKCTVVRKGKFSQYFNPEDIEMIRGHRLDFILRFAFGIIRGDILRAANYGIWSFHHGDETKFRGGPPAFWEIYRGEPVTGAILQRLTDRLDGGVVLQRCHIQTRKFSHGANLNAIVWATTYMPARVCRDILNGCGQYLTAPPSHTDAPIFYSPTDVETAKFMCKTGAAWLKEQVISTLFTSDWNVGLVQEPIQNFLKPHFRPRVHWLGQPNADRFIADPFLLKIGSNIKLLAESFDRNSDRASIVELNLGEMEMSPPSFRTAIDEGIHMSYPHVFEHEGRWYCTPEAYQKRCVALYVLGDQGVWSWVTNLIQDFAAVDPTPFQYEGRWWLFCANHDDEVESKLYLWHAPKLLGPWEQHPGNPIKMDVRSSRPAGRVFFFEGQLYRPAQDSSLNYGGAITVNRVNRLTTREFSEEPVTHISPIMDSSYKRGVHTLVGLGPITVLDGNRLVFSPSLAGRRIKRKVRRLLGLEQQDVSPSSGTCRVPLEMP